MDQDEVYDLVMDPYEERNLAGVPEFAEVEAFLSKALARWRSASYPELEYPTLVERAAELLEVQRVLCILVEARGGGV